MPDFTKAQRATNLNASEIHVPGIGALQPNQTVVIGARLANSDPIRELREFGVLELKLAAASDAVEFDLAEDAAPAEPAAELDDQELDATPPVDHDTNPDGEV